MGKMYDFTLTVGADDSAVNQVLSLLEKNLIKATKKENVITFVADANNVDKTLKEITELHPTVGASVELVIDQSQINKELDFLNSILNSNIDADEIVKKFKSSFTSGIKGLKLGEILNAEVGSNTRSIKNVQSAVNQLVDRLSKVDISKSMDISEMTAYIKDLETAKLLVSEISKSTKLKNVNTKLLEPLVDSNSLKDTYSKIGDIIYNNQEALLTNLQEKSISLITDVQDRLNNILKNGAGFELVPSAELEKAEKELAEMESILELTDKTAKQLEKDMSATVNKIEEFADKDNQNKVSENQKKLIQLATAYAETGVNLFDESAIDKVPEKLEDIAYAVQEARQNLKGYKFELVSEEDVEEQKARVDRIKSEMVEASKSTKESAAKIETEPAVEPTKFSKKVTEQAVTPASIPVEGVIENPAEFAQNVSKQLTVPAQIEVEGKVSDPEKFKWDVSAHLDNIPVDVTFNEISDDEILEFKKKIEAILPTLAVDIPISIGDKINSEKEEKPNVEIGVTPVVDSPEKFAAEVSKQLTASAEILVEGKVNAKKFAKEIQTKIAENPIKVPIELGKIPKDNSLNKLPSKIEVDPKISNPKAFAESVTKQAKVPAEIAVMPDAESLKTYKGIISALAKQAQDASKKASTASSSKSDSKTTTKAATKTISADALNKKITSRKDELEKIKTSLSDINKLTPEIQNRITALQKSIARVSTAKGLENFDAKLKEVKKDAKALTDEYNIATKNNNSLARSYSSLAKNVRRYASLQSKIYLGGTLTGEEQEELAKLEEEYQQVVTETGIYKAATDASTESIEKATVARQKYLDTFDQSLASNISKQFTSYEESLSKVGTSKKIDVNNLKSLLTEIKEINSTPIDIETEESRGKLRDLATRAEEFLSTLKEAPKEVTVASVKNDISSYLEKNTKLSLKARIELQKYAAELESGVTADRLKEIIAAFQKLQIEEREAGREGRNAFDTISQRLSDMDSKFLAQLLSWQDIIRYIREVASAVVELDTALTEMRKVSDESLSSLQRYQDISFGIADEIGVTGQQLQESTADFMRLGESLEDAAESARVANVLMNVSEFESIDEATDSLIAMAAAYSDLEKMDIVDKLNEIGNNYAISTDGIATALQDSASALVTAYNDIDEAIALITAGNAVTQDPAKVGAGLRTIALRLTGTKEAADALNELGEETDNMITTQSKLRETIMNATKAASADGKGFDILDNNGNYKSTYEIMLGLAELYDEIVKKDKELGTNNLNLLLETIAGKNRSNIAASILQNPDLLKNAFEDSAINSANSALEENEKYLESIQGHIEQFKNAVQELFHYLLETGTINKVIDIATDFINFLTEIVKTLGSTGSLFATGGLILLLRKSGPIITSIGKVLPGLVDGTKALDVALSEMFPILSSVIKLFGRLSPISLGVVGALVAIAYAIYEVVEAENEIAEAAQEVGQGFSETKKDIEDYKEEVDELRDILNNSTDLDELRSAREKLLEIQNQMIDAYGTEAGEVIDLTNTINDQTEAWEKLTEAQWQATKNTFNADKKWNLSDDAVRWLHGASDNIGVMLDEIEDAAYTLRFHPTDEDLVKRISQKYNLDYYMKDNAYNINLKGNLYDIQKTALEIQGIVESTEGVANRTVNDIRDEANKISETISNYDDLYKQYVYYERILGNDSYKEKFDAVQKAYADYQEALLNADEQAQKAALKRIVEARESLKSEMKSGGLDAEEQSVLNFIDDLVVQVQDKLDSVEFEVNITANTNDLFTHIEDAISKFENPGNIPDIMLPFGTDSFTDEQEEAWKYLSAVARKYNLTVSELVETLAKLGKIQVDFNYEIPKNLRDEVSSAYSKLQSQMYVGQVEIQELPISHSDLQDAKEYADTLDDIYKQYNGINNMDRDFIYWDDETLEKYRDFVTEQYGTFEEGAKDLKDTWSTVMGGVEDEGEIKIAFSQLLQTDHGLVPLTEDALWEYIDGIYSKAIDENGVFDVEKFIQLDKEGTQMVINGQVENVANMIAAAEGQYLNGIKLTADDVIAIGTPEDALPDDFGESIFKGFSLHEIQEKTLLGSLNEYLMSLEKETLPTLDELFKELEIDTADEYEAVLAIISGCEDWREAVKRVREAFAEVNDTTQNFNFNSLTDAVNDVNKKLLPQFRELGELYDEIFNGEKDFDLSGIGADDLAGIADAFNNLDEALGINPPTEEVERFLSVIGNADSTEKQVHDAFDGIATAYFNAAVEAGNFSEENAAVLEQMLKEMGIANASEVVDYYEQVAVAKKLAADNGKDLANMTAAEIEQFAQEVGASEETANALYILALKKIFLNENWVNEETSIEQVLTLANAAGIATEAVTKLANVQAQISGIKANIANELKSGNPNTTNISDWEAQLAGLEQSAADYAKQIEEDINNVTVDIEFSVPKTSSGSSGSAGSAGKDAGDEYVKAFEEELKSLERVRDAGVISEKEFLERYKALIEKYFKDVDGYADEYADRMKDYFDRLTSYYENVFSAIGTVLSHRISALQDAKSAAVDAINAEKDAAAESYQAQIDYIDELIDAKEEEISAIEKEIDRYQDQIDAIDKQIDALEEANKKRQQAINLQKAQYDLERAQQQRTKLIYKGGQLVYENDTSAVRDARENLEDAEFEIQKQKLEDLKKPLQEQIELLEKRKELIQDEIDGYKKQQEALQKALEASNKYYDKMIKDTEKYWDTLIEQLEKTKSKFEEIAELKALSEAYYLIQDYLKGTEYTLEDIFNGTPEMFDKFIEDYKKVLLGANSYNEDFAASLALAEQDIRGSLGNISSSASEIETALGPAVSALVPLGEEATNIEATATALEKVADNSEKVSTNTGTAATNSGNLATSLGSVAEVSPNAAKGIGDAAESIEKEGNVAGNANTNLEKFATIDERIANESATKAENVEKAAQAIKDEGDNAANAYTSLNNVANLNLATIVTQTNLLADAIGEVAAALGLTEGNPISALQTAISNLATISLGDESSGIIGSFNQLKTAVNGVTSAIGGGGGGDSEGGDGTTDKSASMSEGANDGGSGGLISAIGDLHEAADTHIGTSAEGGGEEEGGTVISDFNALKDAVMLVAEAVGVPGENGEVAEESLLGVIKTMPAECEEPITTVTGFFAALEAAINACSTAVGKLKDAIKELGGSGGGGLGTFSFSPGAATGNVHIAEATGNVHAGNAYSSGRLGLKKNETALVGEAGQELVYNPKSGTYRTVGDKGPEITRLQKGDLIFNAEQTKAIIKNGKRDHGRSYADGNAIMPLTSEEMELFKKIGGAVTDIQADVSQMLDPIKAMAQKVTTNNTTNIAPVINITDTSFNVSGVTGDDVTRQIADVFEGMISNAYQRAMKK